MKRVYKYFLPGFLAFAFPILFFFVISSQSKEKVLGLFVKPTPTLTPTLTPTSPPTPSPQPSPTPSPSPTPTLTMTPTPTSPPQPTYSPEQINAFIERFAGQYGVDPNLLRHLAVCESNFNQAAVNGPYAGLYQFELTTWRKNRQLMNEETDINLRLNAEEAVQTAAFVVSIGRGTIWPNCYPP